MKNKIIVVGSLNMDLVVHAPRHPNSGETILGSAFNTFPGGKGANQAVAAARLGVPVTLIGRVGQDAFGQNLLHTVKQSSVNTEAIIQDPQAATGVALIVLDSAGQNTIVVAPGANAQLSPADIQAAEMLFEQAGILVLQLETTIPAVETAVKLAKKWGLRIILNPAPAQPLPDDLLVAADYLVPNQHELSLIAAQPTVELALQSLQQRGAHCLVVTLGGDGVRVVNGSQQFALPSHSVKVVDTVAAGDAFVGAFAVALSEDKSLQEAVQWGNAAGAIAVTRLGAQPSLPTRAELEKFLS